MSSLLFSTPNLPKCLLLKRLKGQNHLRFEVIIVKQPSGFHKMGNIPIPPEMRRDEQQLLPSSKSVQVNRPEK